MIPIMDNNTIRLNIDGKIYTPEMPKHWFAVNYGTSLPLNDKWYHPFTLREEPAYVISTVNNRLVYFKNLSMFYEPLIFRYLGNCYSSNYRIISPATILAIRNWQIHTRCFDYMECPLL